MQLELNSLGTAEDRQTYRNALVLAEQRSEALDHDSQARLSTNPLRILDSKNKDTQALLEKRQPLPMLFPMPAVSGLLRCNAG